MVFAALLSLVSLVPLVAAQDLERGRPDPCVAIAGQKWVAPAALRACFESFKVDAAAKSNILEVTTKTLPFHTSVNYQILAPPPFSTEVHEDILADLARIKKQSYKSEYAFHIDISRSFKRLNDGHCVWVNSCYDSAFLNYLPVPLVVLTNAKGVQTINISPVAFKVATAEFPDQIDVWQNALPGPLKGKLNSLDGAQVLTINGQDPWAAVNTNAAITGSYQGFGTRQNSFFSSYQRAASSWSFLMGNFAQEALPLHDDVTLSLKLVNSTGTVQVKLPYRARRNAALDFTDGADYRAKNCLARDGTNGVDVYSQSEPETIQDEKFRQAPPTPKSSRKHLQNTLLDDTPLQNVVLPPELTPGSPVSPGAGVGQFYIQPDGKTGVLALGSFSGVAYELLMSGLLEGLLELKARGATQLIIDVTNNGGGFICVAHFLHRILVGPKASTVPNAGLYTAARAGPLASAIVDSIVQNNTDPDFQLLYNPQNWRKANNEFFGAQEDWLANPDIRFINFHKDAFSQKLGQECQPEGFTTAPPEEALFEGSKVVIVSNGRCGSSCSLFSITMTKFEGTKTVVVGGKKDIKQQYCGVVGGQSTGFSTIDTEIKSSKLKSSPLAAPDLIVNGVLGITWRLGFGAKVDNPPEEWQDHPATINLPLTPALATNPTAIWTAVAARVFG